MYLTPTGKGCGIRVFVQPRASRTHIVGLHDGMVKLAIAAPPVEGRANKEVVAFFSKLFAVSKSDIQIVSGEHSRRKICVIGTLDETLLRGTLAPLLLR